MVRAERTSSEWFAEAERCYIEQHQGCAWCGGSHRVFQVRRGNCVEYACNGCDFRVSHNKEAKEYLCVPGVENVGKAPETMFEI
jgi:hypothetical protein